MNRAQLLCKNNKLIRFRRKITWKAIHFCSFAKGKRSVCLHEAIARKHDQTKLYDTYACGTVSFKWIYALAKRNNQQTLVSIWCICVCMFDRVSTTNDTWWNLKLNSNPSRKQRFYSHVGTITAAATNCTELSQLTNILFALSFLSDICYGEFRIE